MKLTEDKGYVVNWKLWHFICDNHLIFTVVTVQFKWFFQAIVLISTIRMANVNVY